MPSHKRSPVRVVTFDLDDTLWDLTPVLLRAERLCWEWLVRRCPELGLHFSIEALRELKAGLVAQQPELLHQISQQRLLTLEVALAQSGCEPSVVRQLAREAFEVFLLARHEVTFFDDALEVLAALSRDYTLGALTNGNADVERLGLARYFDFALAAEQVNASKPAPDLFLAAMARTGVDAPGMVHVGDHIENDVRAAQRLGIAAVWVNLDGQVWPGPDGPAAEVRSLRALPETIAALGAGPGRH